MFAQRMGTVYESPKQVVQAFVDSSDAELANQINRYIEQFLVQVVNVAYSVVVTPNRVQHYALVTFEVERPGSSRA